MKRVLIVILLLAVALSMGCEQRQIQVSLTSTKLLYHTCTDPTFNETSWIRGDDIRDAADLPDNAQIDSVAIENISLSIRMEAGNDAQELEVDAYFKRGGGANVYIFRNNPPLNLVGINAPVIGANKILGFAAADMQSSLNKYLKGVTEPDLEVHIEGNTLPAGSALDVTVIMRIKFTVVYQICIEATSFIGEDCTL